MLTRHRKRLQALSVVAVFFWTGACAIKVDVTSQRTALENQVMGSYSQLDDDLVLNSSVRGPGSQGLKEEALLAKQNQAFNLDDIEELKSKGILGESNNGMLRVLSVAQGRPEGASQADLKLAAQLVEEENRDRKIIWRQIIATNKSLSESNMIDVQKTYAKSQRDKSSPGHWYESENGKWQQAVAGEAAPQKVDKDSEVQEEDGEN